MELSVRTGPVDWEAEAGENAWSGLSIGAGGSNVDHRRTALVHHLPAPDGGIVVIVDPMGAVSIHDNEQTTGKTPTWSISGDITRAELPLLSTNELVQKSPIGPDGIELRVRIKEDPDGGYRVGARVFDAEGTTLISSATASGLPGGKVDGGFGLVSHHGPTGSNRGYWFNDLRATGPGVVRHPERGFGPIIGTLYTVDDRCLKLTAQFPPLGAADERTTALQIQPEPQAFWETVDTREIDPDSRTATFRVENWSHDRDIPYRVVYAQSRRDGTATAHDYHGVIREEPDTSRPLVMGSLTCHKTYTGGLQWNANGLWFPHEELVGAVAVHDPTCSSSRVTRYTRVISHRRVSVTRTP